MSVKRNLFANLALIAAEKLKYTYGWGNRSWQKDIESRCMLLEAAFTADAVERDFEVWCQEQLDASHIPSYPLSAYLKEVQERLGPKLQEPEKEMASEDEKALLIQVRRIGAASYDQTGYAPADKDVKSLLKSSSVEDILAALDEYAVSLDEKRAGTAMERFFKGGAATVIYAQAQRREKKS